MFSKDAVCETSILPIAGDRFKTNDVIQCESVNNKNKKYMRRAHAQSVR